MKKILSVLLIPLLLTTACATTLEPTAVPASANPTVAPQTQATTSPELPPPSKCQSKLLGRIMDANGAIGKGAVVEIRNGSFNAKTLSDDNGLYGFAGLCAGTYRFTVTLSGQAPKALAATATADGANTAKADLTVK